MSCGGPGNTGGPHGLRRLVDACGTHGLDLAQAIELAHPGVLDAALDRIEASLRSDQ